MSLRSLIVGASDVLFRFDQNLLRVNLIDYIEYLTSTNRNQFMSHLGETNDNIQQQYKNINAQTVLSVWESKCKDAKTAVGSFVSQELLQSLRILQEYELVNRERTTISPQLLLYELACFFLDTKEQVEIYRRLYEIIDDCSKISDQYTNISSGSTAEGVDIPGGDYDLMTILENITVDIDGSEVHKEGPILLYNTENSYPGYAHLKISKSQYSDDVFRHWGETSTWGTLISNKRFKNYFFERYRDNNTKIHGPCISSYDETVDHLFCLRSLSWPPVAKQWIQRARLKEWPSNDIVSNVIKEGVLFVPIGSKFCGTEDYPLEWRISFSLAEKKLIHSFSHTQLLCYKLCKYIKKDVVKPLLGCEQLSSYIFKTTLFWMCEEQTREMWNAEYMFGFQQLQRRLLYWISYEFCPHYFIPNNNLFEGVMNDETKLQLQFVFKNLVSLVLQSLHYGQALDKYSIRQVYMCIKTRNIFLLKMKTVLSSLRHVRLIYRSCTKTQIDSIMSKSLFRLSKSKFSYFPKGLYLLSFCLSNQISAQLTRLGYDKNKKAYRTHKTILSKLLVGSYGDGASGWLLISQYLCEIGQYYAAIQATTLVEEKGNIESIIPLSNYEKTTEFIDRKICNWSSEISFLKYLKSLCIDYVYLLPDPAWFFRELSTDIGLHFEVIPPIVFLHFVRFVCFSRQGDTKQRDKVLEDLTGYVRSNHLIEHPKARVIAYAVLAKAYASIQDTKAAKYWRQQVLRYYSLIWLRFIPV